MAQPWRAYQSGSETWAVTWPLYQCLVLTQPQSKQRLQCVAIGYQRAAAYRLHQQQSSHQCLGRQHFSRWPEYCLLPLPLNHGHFINTILWVAPGIGCLLLGAQRGLSCPLRSRWYWRVTRIRHYGPLVSMRNHKKIQQYLWTVWWEIIKKFSSIYEQYVSNVLCMYTLVYSHGVYVFYYVLIICILSMFRLIVHRNDLYFHLPIYTGKNVQWTSGLTILWGC